MAVLTSIELSAAQQIGSEYGLDVVAIRGILAGSVNTNYECTLASGGRTFLRIYEEQGEEGALREIRLLHHLASRGVKTVEPLPRLLPSKDANPKSDNHPSGPLSSNKELTLSSYSGKAAAMFPWVDGEILCQKRVTESVMEQVGKALGKIHLAGIDFQGAEPSRFDTGHLLRRIEKLRTQGFGKMVGHNEISGGELGEHVEMLAEKVMRHKGWENSLDQFPSALVHGDVFRDNVLWQDGQMVAVLDFESASLGSVTFDLCVTMLAWCYNETLVPELARALARGYTQERALTVEDKTRLYQDALFAALRFCVTRITDYELRPPGTGIYKNYRRFLGRLAAIETLGPRGLSEMLGVSEQ